VMNVGVPYLPTIVLNSLHLVELLPCFISCLDTIEDTLALSKSRR
jgi:hypothetical protein